MRQAMAPTKPARKPPVKKSTKAPAQAKAPLNVTTEAPKAPDSFILRTPEGAYVRGAVDIESALLLSRTATIKTNVWKVTPEGEVLMSYQGNGSKWGRGKPFSFELSSLKKDAETN